MKSSDITLTIFIILIFMLLFMYNILSVGIQNIENNWPTYRCNPVVMPFASIFGQDTMQNFTFCIQTMQSNYMDYLMQPLNYNINVIGNIGSTLSDSINSARAFVDNLRNFITNLIQNVFAVFLNILVEFQKIMVDIKDMMSKTAGILATLLYTVEGSMLTMESTWNGAPGQMVRSLQGLCFHPDTIIQIKDGSLYKMKDLPLNSILKNGAVVQSVMKISNSDFREELFTLDGEDRTNIYVTGCHLIYDVNASSFISVHKMSEMNPNICRKCSTQTDELSCLITSNHTIPIGRWLFHDWEDNNGTASKAI